MNPPSIQSSMSASSPSTANVLSPSSQNNQAAFYQYLTPPSQHSGSHTPQHMVQTLDSYPTPSPESPGHWSSSSPRSDWSEGVQSPATNNLYISGGHQANKGSEAIYIWQWDKQQQQREQIKEQQKQYHCLKSEEQRNRREEREKLMLMIMTMWKMSTQNHNNSSCKDYKTTQTVHKETY